MWILKWIFGALLIIIILGFALQNQDQTISVHILKWESPVIPLYFLIYLSFIAGLLSWLLFSTYKIFRLKGKNYSLQHEVQKLKKQLNRLRNANIEDVVETEDSDFKDNNNISDKTNNINNN